MTSLDHVYKGFWVDYSFGPIHGATLTLSARNGAFLVAFVTMFVTVAGSQAWVLICFTAHQLRVDRDRRDALFHQQQAVFRNTLSAFGAAWEFWTLLLAWQKAAKRPIARNLPWILAALLCFAAFSVAGIFSSQVTLAASSKVLLKSPYCGYYNGSLLDAGISGSMATIDYSQVSGSNAIRQRLAQTALSYAKACYGNTTNAQCNIYKSRKLPWTSRSDIPCPYEASICGENGKSVFELDTGLLDSQIDLGLNTPAAHKVLFRRKTTCAHLNSSHYAAFWNTPEGGPYAGDTLVNLTMGPAFGVNNTFQWNTRTPSVGIGYQIFSINYHPGLNLSNITYTDGSQLTGWDPVDALKSDSDVSLIVIPANGIAYAAPVDDPVFAAHDKFNFAVRGENFTLYTKDRLLPAIACNDAFQFCNGQRCTPMGGVFKVDKTMREIGFSDIQLANADLINRINEFSTMYDSVYSSGVTALLANEVVVQQLSQGLPANQWQLEIGNWFNTALAQLQIQLFMFQDGYTHNITEVARPSGKIGDLMCRSQLIQNTSNHLNFSVLGLLLILIIGGVLIIFGLSIEWLSSVFHRLVHGRGALSYRELSWATDYKFQLQRLAYEGAGWEGWTSCTEYIPVTTDGDDAKLGFLVVDDPPHPTIERRLYVGNVGPGYENTAYGGGQAYGGTGFESAAYAGQGYGSTGFENNPYGEHAGTTYQASGYDDVISPSSVHKDEFTTKEDAIYTKSS